METYISALLREASARAEYVTEPLETVYIGGGTPSLLPPDLFTRLADGLRALFPFDSVREFTAEANPGTVTEEWLEAARRAGAGRISFGIQAAQNRLLRTLGRIHRFPDASDSVRLARKHGFTNVSVDLMFGIPGQTMADWRETLRSALSLSPDHISAYGLIPEEDTPLFRDLSSGMLALPDPDLERDMYDEAISVLAEAGLFQYEISNFARPGYECRHNMGYWDQVPYLGLGLSAASMIRRNPPDSGCFSFRWTNPGTFAEYEALAAHPEKLDEIKETVSPDEARFETVMLSLRKTAGLSRERFRELHGEYPEEHYGERLACLAAQGLMEQADGYWRLTRRGMDIQNSVLVELMDG